LIGQAENKHKNLKIKLAKKIVYLKKAKEILNMEHVGFIKKM